MAFSSATVDVGGATKKADYDRLLENDKYLYSSKMDSKYRTATISVTPAAVGVAIYSATINFSATFKALSDLHFAGSYVYSAVTYYGVLDGDAAGRYFLHELRPSGTFLKVKMGIHSGHAGTEAWTVRIFSSALV